MLNRRQRWGVLQMSPGTTEMDLFKAEFKFYKSRASLPDFSSVLDFCKDNDQIELLLPTELSASSADYLTCGTVGLLSPKEWKIYTLKEYPGFYCILNPFQPDGQRLWIRRCLDQYSQKPNQTNLDPMQFDHPDSQLDIRLNNGLVSKLRWATLGYHHDWDNKIYDLSKHSPIPEEMQLRAKCITSVLGFDSYRAEAAIVNFYDMNSTLGGHTDHSELNLVSPLISVSFGQTAIFLLGGKTKQQKPCAMYLRSGDILVMSGSTRLAYHAVPRIVRTAESPWNHVKLNDRDWEPYDAYVSNHRININIRQKLQDVTLARQLTSIHTHTLNLKLNPN